MATIEYADAGKLILSAKSAEMSQAEYVGRRAAELEADSRKILADLQSARSPEAISGFEKRLSKIAQKRQALQRGIEFSSLRRRRAAEKAAGAEKLSFAGVEQRLLLSAARRPAVKPTEAEATAQGTDFIFTGYAAKYNEFSADLGSFVEKIKRGAFDEVLREDTKLLLNHDPNLILGRVGKNVTLFSDSVGLGFYAEPLPDHTLTKDVLQDVRFGILSQCSFAFSIAKGGDEWLLPHRLGETDIRIISKVERLYDISIVCYPAYWQTTVEAVPARRCDADGEIETADENGEASESMSADDYFADTDEILRQGHRRLEAAKEKMQAYDYRQAGRIIARCGAKPGNG